MVSSDSIVTRPHNALDTEGVNPHSIWLIPAGYRNAGAGLVDALIYMALATGYDSASRLFPRGDERLVRRIRIVASEGSEDCLRVGRILEEAGVPYTLSPEDQSGGYAIYVQDRFLSKAIEALRSLVLETIASDSHGPRRK
jgi:hypothetical protein